MKPGERRQQWQRRHDQRELEGYKSGVARAAAPRAAQGDGDDDHGRRQGAAQRACQVEVVGQEPAHRTDEADVGRSRDDEVGSRQVEAVAPVVDEALEADKRQGGEGEQHESGAGGADRTPASAEGQPGEQDGGRDLDRRPERQRRSAQSFAGALQRPEREGQDKQQETVDLTEHQRVECRSQGEQQSQRDGHPASAAERLGDDPGRDDQGHRVDHEPADQHRLHAERLQDAKQSGGVGGVTIGPGEVGDVQPSGESTPRRLGHSVRALAMRVGRTRQKIHHVVERLVVGYDPDDPAAVGGDQGDEQGKRGASFSVGHRGVQSSSDSGTDSRRRRRRPGCGRRGAGDRATGRRAAAPGHGAREAALRPYPPAAPAAAPRTLRRPRRRCRRSLRRPPPARRDERWRPLRRARPSAASAGR